MIRIQVHKLAALKDRRYISTLTAIKKALISRVVGILFEARFIGHKVSISILVEAIYKLVLHKT